MVAPALAGALLLICLVVAIILCVMGDVSFTFVISDYDDEDDTNTIEGDS